ncbi:hypothetical protein [Fortiea contorta]|uniref:hypothetical protein n=1 Tax=Fortiea contorta TaxID=1892405 RepID=UPI00034C6183|nr:hypothetical protein [Fortiea contorta]
MVEATEKEDEKKTYKTITRLTIHLNSKDKSAVEEDIQQQHSNLISNQATLADEGIHFDESEKEVLNHSNPEIKVSIALFKIRGGFDKISNPEGFIRSCLRQRWWEHPTNIKQLNAIPEYAPNSTFWDELKGVES